MRLFTAAAAAAAVVAVLAAGCGGDGGAPAVEGQPPPAAQTPVVPAAEPRTGEAVKKAAQEYMDEFAAGDYPGAWALLSLDAQKALPQASYEKVFELCPPAASGVPATIDAVRLAADKNSAVVRFTRLTFKFSTTVLYEGGHWKVRPDAQTMAEYRLGDPAKIVAKRRARGGCG